LPAEGGKCGIVPPWSFRGLADELWLPIESRLRRSDHESIPTDKACLQGIAGKCATKNLGADTVPAPSPKVSELRPAVLIHELPDARSKVDLGILADEILSTRSPTAMD
jgi:hypothetical protein